MNEKEILAGTDSRIKGVRKTKAVVVEEPTCKFLKNSLKLNQATVDELGLVDGNYAVIGDGNDQGVLFLIIKSDKDGFADSPLRPNKFKKDRSIACSGDYRIAMGRHGTNFRYEGTLPNSEVHKFVCIDEEIAEAKAAKIVKVSKSSKGVLDTATPVGVGDKKVQTLSEEEEDAMYDELDELSQPTDSEDDPIED